MSHLMEIANVPADWRHRRLAVQVKLPDDAMFVNVEAPETRELLRQALASTLVFYGEKDLDISVVRGKDRRITRWISQYIYEYVEEDQFPFAGIMYKSRLDNDWVAWALFQDGQQIRELDRLPIAREMRQLQQIAKRYGLTVH
jgi:hypothetical protein